MDGYQKALKSMSNDSSHALGRLQGLPRIKDIEQIQEICLDGFNCNNAKSQWNIYLKKTDASGTESKVTFKMLSRVECFSKDAYRQKIK